jgi:hypothetical protein
MLSPCFTVLHFTVVNYALLCYPQLSLAVPFANLGYSAFTAKFYSKL